MRQSRIARDYLNGGRDRYDPEQLRCEQAGQKGGYHCAPIGRRREQ